MTTNDSKFDDPVNVNESRRSIERYDTLCSMFCAI